VIVLYESTNVAKVIKTTAKAKNIQLKDMLIELELSKDTLSNMYRGSMLKGDSLARIADYLDVSVDYLLGRTDEQATTHYSNNVSDNNFSNFVHGNGAVTVGSFSVGSISNPQNADYTQKETQQNKLSDEETEILDIYRSLNIRKKAKFLNMALDIEKEKSN